MSRTRTVFLGDAECEVRYDFQPAEATVYNPPDRAHQGCDAEVAINEILINGEWVSADLFDKSWIKQRESDLLVEIDEELRERDLL